MSAAIIITNATAGAPVLNGTEGSLSALFRYLAPILGWSIESDNGPIIVVKPQSYKGGQALLYRIDDRAARGGAAPRVAEVRAYESMSDINTGLGLVGPTYVCKSYSADTVSRPWDVIGDQYGFYLSTAIPYSLYYNATNTQMLHYLGFANNELYPSLVPVCVLFGGPDKVSQDTDWPKMTTTFSATTASAAYMFVHRNRGGALNVPVCCCFNGGPHPIGEAFGNKDALPAMPAYTGTLIRGRPFINNGVGHSVMDFLPGYYYPCHSSGITSRVNIPDGSSTLLPLYVYGADKNKGGGFILFEISEGFRP